LFLEKAIPVKARDAYRRDAWGGMLAGLFNGAINPFLGFIARDTLNANGFIIGLMFAAPAIGSIFALLYANYMEGKQKMPYVVWPGVIGRGLFVFSLFAFTPTIFAIIVFLSLSLTSIIGPGYAAVLKEIYPDSHRGQIMGYIRVGMSFMNFTATLIVGYLLDGGKLPFIDITIPKVSFQILFPIAAILGMCSSLAFGSIKTAPVPAAKESAKKTSVFTFIKNTLHILVEDKTFAWFCIAIFVSGFGNLVVIPLYPIFQVDYLHISAAQIAMIVNATTIIWMLSYLYWGKHVDAKCPITATMISVFIGALLPLTYVFATKVWMLYPSALFSGITNAGTELAYFNSILMLSKRGRESQYQALHSFLFGIRGTIAPFAGVALYKTGMGIRYIFFLSFLMMVIGGLIQLKSINAHNRQKG
jgi:DHA1 family inner membrane transport protein